MHQSIEDMVTQILARKRRLETLLYLAVQGNQQTTVHLLDYTVLPLYHLLASLSFC